MLKITPKSRLLLFVGVAGLLALVLYGYSRGSGPTPYVSVPVQRGEIRDAVEATGTINAVVVVQVGSQVSGTIAKLNADYNSAVHRGDVVAVIDPALFQGALAQARADLESAQANVGVVDANLVKSRATEVQAKADYDRAIALVKQKLVSQQALDVAKATYETAQAGVAAAVASIAQAKAQVRQKEAAVNVAQTNLDYTQIHSPIDGVVVARNVDVGQTVAASLQAPTIFTIAQDLTKMLLYAKTDESEVGRIKVGQEVAFKVDAFPKQIFRGRVSQMRMNATTVQNVVTYDTVIEFENPDLKLFPGMTAYVTIPVATVENVIKVPNTALRFQPSVDAEETKTLYMRYGIDSTAQEPTSADRAGHRERAVIWKLRSDGTLEPVAIEVGITDHAFTEIVKVSQGSLKVEDNVVTALVGAGKPQPRGR